MSGTHYFKELESVCRSFIERGEATEALFQEALRGIEEPKSTPRPGNFLPESIRCRSCNMVLPRCTKIRSSTGDHSRDHFFKFIPR